MITSHPIISAITFLLILFPPCGNAVPADNAVFDTKGRPLRAKSRYYILPVAQGQGGGLTMSPKNRTTFCPLHVAQEDQEIYPGLPVWFLPKDSSQRVVTLSSDLNILFNTVNICLQSAGWQLIVDHTMRRKYVTTGGAIGNPGEETISSWFSIEKAGRGVNIDDYHYMIVYCPNVCQFCMVMCGHVGVFVQEDGSRLLGLTDRPLHVMFKKARSRSKSS
ncbi:kunitz trypsin inhibitor 2-like [Chenopodium quinoa]|uniref:Miraculin-like n=1 Tax=Chenopodium quinoa TaxID=63459 RepID=A0A803L1P7_CHEQI|nr:kunitz trypsin inhibitor 2-like [Chenopodium quinoa]